MLARNENSLFHVQQFADACYKNQKTSNKKPQGYQRVLRTLARFCTYLLTPLGLSAHQGAGAMTSRETALAIPEPSPVWRGQFAITAGRIGLALALLAAWKLGADAVGSLYVGDPIGVFQRILSDTLSGGLLRHVYVTLRLSATGFAIGCGFGVALPFLLRRMPRLTRAVEPYIMASVGVPKYALVPLFILWFGIDDAPKLWLVGLLVFYPVFIAVFAGIRNVDRRLISMARVVGASEAAISREVIWN